MTSADFLPFVVTTSLKNKNEDRTKDNKKKKDYSSIVCGESHSFKPDFYKTIIEQNGQVY